MPTEDISRSPSSSSFGFLPSGNSPMKHLRIQELSQPGIGRVKTPSPNKMPYTEEYLNDESYLPDAPTPVPRRRPAWAKEAKVQEFYQDLAIDEMLDSTLEDIRSSPYQKIENISEDEMSLSIEVLEEIQQLALASPQQPLTPPDSASPLVPDLDEADEKKLSTMLQITANGRKQCDVLDTRLKTHDFQTLLPSEFNGNPMAWLNDNIVNEYLSILVDHQKAAAGYKHVRGGAAPPVHAFASQWYSSASRNLKSVSRWASKKQLGGQQLLDAKLLLIPVCEGGHWRLVAIKPQERSIEYLDSLGFDGSQILTTAVAWLKQELGEHWRGEEWSVVEKQRSVEQLNGSDCGVFTCLNALALVRGEEPSRVKSLEGMHEARRRIAVSLFSRQPTGEL
jgi:Ulp1 family protease